jgi:uncharacterized repeat protein (TIGR03803 family)
MVSGPNGQFYASVAHVAGSANIFSVGPVPGGPPVYPNQSMAAGLGQSLPAGAFLGVGVSLSPWYLILVDLGGLITPLHEFPDNALPSNALYATDCNYYGVASGTLTSTYVYRVTPSGSFSKLYTFPSVPFPFAGMPPASLLQAGDGNLYGILPSGGANGTGAVYKLTLSGQYTLLYSFPERRQWRPHLADRGQRWQSLWRYAELCLRRPIWRLRVVVPDTRSGQYVCSKRWTTAP